MRGSIKCALHPDCSTVEADILGHAVTYKIGRARPSSRASIRSPCWRRPCWSAPISRSRRWRSPSCKPASGRGTRIELELPGGTALLIDESYNANPGLDARRARAARPGADRPARPAHRRARRHAGTRPRAAGRCIAAWSSRVAANAVDLVFCCGPLMRALWQALPAEPPRRLCGGVGARLSRRYCRAIRAGDAVMVKGSLGSRMGPIVKALESARICRARARTAVQTASAQG